MRTVETTGANIEEAIEKGLKLLDVARENVIVEIIEEPNRGLLGLGAKEAVVRLTTVVPPRSERAKYVSTPEPEEPPIRQNEPRQYEERPRRPDQRDSRGGRNEGRNEGRGGERPYRERNDRGGERGGGDRGGRGGFDRDRRGGGGDRRGRGGRDGDGGSNRDFRRQRDQEYDAELDTIEVTRQTEAMHDLTTIPDAVQIGYQTLIDLLARMNMLADVTVERITTPTDTDDEPETPWLLHVHGGDFKSLIGRRGETLAALQYLTRLIASRGLQARAEFSVDVENYRAKRDIQLHRIAERQAQEAISRNRTIYLEPMAANERRIIHMVLRDHPQVYTESKGEGDERRVTIVPKPQEQEQEQEE